MKQEGAKNIPAHSPGVVRGRFSADFINRTLNPDWKGRAEFSSATGFAIDTRELQPGQIFVALKTENRDGHDFLRQAREAGASGALVERANGNLALPQAVVSSSSEALTTIAKAHRERWKGHPLIAVTGSCGKTSTKDLLGLLLGREQCFVSRGNLNNHLGVPLSLLEMDDATESAVLEAGISGPGEMQQLADTLQPDWTVVTTISPAHVEKIGSLAQVAQEKEFLASAAGSAVFLGSACAEYDVFRNADYPETHWVYPEAKVPSQSLPGENWRYRVAHRGDGWEDLTLCHGECYSFRVPGTTAGMLENMALSLAVALRHGMDPDVLGERLAAWRPCSQRGEVLHLGDRVVYADHYNANPSSMADAMDYFDRTFPDAPRCWVLGGMEELGSHSALWHRRMADVLPVRPGDSVFLVGGSTGDMTDILRGKPGVVTVEYADTIEGILDRVLEVPGVLFLKGSRKYHLEKVLEKLEAMSSV